MPGLAICVPARFAASRAAQIEAVLAEAEACFRTVAALESGALKYYRFEAIAHYSFW